MQTLQIQSLTVDELKNFITSAVRDAIPQAPEPTNTPEFLTRHEAAQMLGVSLVTIDKWSHEGHLQKYRIGGRIRFKAAEVGKGLTLVKNLKYKRP
jgi:excisionase family DNA binding protein